MYLAVQGKTKDRLYRDQLVIQYDALAALSVGTPRPFPSSYSHY